jgi:uncharacterized RDD family membrane protein YckC
VAKYQTFWKRFFAGLFDGLLFIPVFLIAENFIATDNKWAFIGIEFFSTVCWLMYTIIGHGRYGQTLGKKLMGIKVLDIGEKTVIGCKRAFFRESIWFCVSIAGLIYLVYTSRNATFIDEQMAETYDSIVTIISTTWFVVELITMLLNNKRRAVHDFFANSVVIDLKEAAKEN